MNRTRNYIIIFLLGAGLTACSSFSPHFWSSDTQSIENIDQTNPEIEDIVQPYRDSISEDMNRVLGTSPMNLVKDRPCSPLNNWAADAVYRHQMKRMPEKENVMVLLNVGGLRSSINQGPITKGEVFSFMPFDNEVVWVKMPISALQDIQAYLKASGGEPIANALMVNGSLSILNMKDHIDYFWVLTSDYLMNGGDKMNFFQQKLDVILTGDLLRDVYLEQVQKEGTLIIDQTCRINVD